MDTIRRSGTGLIRCHGRDTCTTCAQSKALCHHPYRLLKQLPIPEKPWNSILMDFIEQLPLSSSFTAILVVVDQLSKQSIVIPTHNTISSPELTKLCLLHMFSKHGVLAHVVDIECLCTPRPNGMVEQTKQQVSCISLSLLNRGCI